MKKLVPFVAFLAVSLLSGCAQHADTAPAKGALLANVCVISGEALEAGSPTAEFGDGHVAFCCDKCKAKWDKMDDAGKKAALAKATGTK
ncbi:MAG: hypothetical protein JNK78_10805 [Planctomycetes bacterium]|nr:hypothetical protein [Planctomycetota bacterium]